MTMRIIGLALSAGMLSVWPSMAAAQPRGTLVYSASPGPGRGELFLLELPGGTPEKIDLHRLQQANGPVWSPDGTWIAFSGGVGAFSDGIYRVDLDGSAPRKLTPIQGDLV